jgi:hypothetical protein
MNIISEKDEILVKFANNLKQSELQKVAWDWADIGNALGLDALLGAGIGAGSAAAAGTGIGAGILGGLGIGTGIVPAVLAAAGVAYTVYSVMQHADDNVEDLISRLDALDPNDKAKNVVDTWIKELEQFKNVFQIQVKSQDPTQRASQIKEQIQNISSLLAYLKGMWEQWGSEIKPNLTDWGFDAKQAETALTKTIQATETGLAQIKQSAQQEGSKLIKEMGKQTGQDYQAGAKQVIDLHNQIVQISGVAPEYEKYEVPAFNLAQNILAGKAEIQDINQYGSMMMRLISGLQALLKQEQRKQGGNKKKSFQKLNISKRAVHMPGATPAGGGEKQKSVVSPEAQKSQSIKDPVVVALQKALNYLNINLKTGISRIAEDGDYGTNTSVALHSLLEKYPAIENYMTRSIGINKDDVKNTNLMKQDKEYLTGLAGLLSAVVNKMKPQEQDNQGKKQPNTQTQYDQKTQCREDKEDPSPEEILACLRNRMLRDPQTEQNYNAYEYLKQKGMRDNDIVALMVRLFRGAKSEDWSMPLLLKYVSGPRFDVLRGY